MGNLQRRYQTTVLPPLLIAGVGPPVSLPLSFASFLCQPGSSHLEFSATRALIKLGLVGGLESQLPC